MGWEWELKSNSHGSPADFYIQMLGNRNRIPLYRKSSKEALQLQQSLCRWRIRRESAVNFTVKSMVDELPGHFISFFFLFFFFSCSCCSSCSCWGSCWVGTNAAKKSPRLRRFKPDWDEIWQECSTSEYASNDGVGFRMWRHTFKIGTMTSLRKTPLVPCIRCDVIGSLYALR